MFDINEFDLLYEDEDTCELGEMVGASSDDVLVACLNKLGRVDIEQMSNSSGKTCEQLVLDLRGSAIFQDPIEFEFDDQWDINKGWQLRSQYCCGNIHRKLAVTEQMNEKFPGCFQFDRSDYDFAQPDRRYSTDVILPSFCENVDGSKVEKLWFLVDTSGSVSDEAVSVAYEEIKQATMQINLSGMLSFFDYTVSEPIPFETLEDILSIKPVGGGGTNFRAIFKKLEEYVDEDNLPNVIVIITDGYDSFPDEEVALGVPVIWIIVDSDVVPPWGTYTFIST